jgi:hypothetical protein
LRKKRGVVVRRELAIGDINWAQTKHTLLVTAQTKAIKVVKQMHQILSRLKLSVSAAIEAEGAHTSAPAAQQTTYHSERERATNTTACTHIQREREWQFPAALIADTAKIRYQLLST